MSYYREHQTTQAEVDAYRDSVRKQFKGFPFDIESNGKGLRVECRLCHNSSTQNPESFIRRHSATHVPLLPH